MFSIWKGRQMIMTDFEKIKVDLKESRELTWVPDNLSKLSKLNFGISPCLIGLPFVKLYYSTPKRQAGVYNRLEDGNRLLHAFRILVGTAWNWAVCNACGYKISFENLFESISRLCRECGCLKGESYAKQFGIDENSDDYRYIMDLFERIIELHDQKELDSFFKENLAKYSIQEKALITLVSLDIQEQFKKKYGNKKACIKAFRAEFQQKFNFEVSITKDVNAWVMNYTDTELRKKSWLEPKTIQRKCKGRNSKAKHGTRQSTVTPQCQRSVAISEPSERDPNRKTGGTSS